MAEENEKNQINQQKKLRLEKVSTNKLLIDSWLKSEKKGPLYTFGSFTL